MGEQQASTVSTLAEKCKTLEESDAQKSKDLISTNEILSELQHWKSDTLVDIEKLRQNLEQQTSTAQELAQSRDEFKAADIEKAAELKGLNAWKEAAEKEAQKMQTLIAERVAQVEKLEASSAKQIAKIADHSQKIADLQQQLTQKKNQADSLAKLRDDLQASVAQLSEELDTLRGWKDQRLRDLDQARSKFLDRVAT